jgi:hypothetical protein
MTPVRVVGVGIATLAFLSVSSPSPARAQSNGDGFLFGAPHGEVSIRGGFNHATAGSDIFTFTENQLTVAKRDFSAVAFATDVDVALTPRTSMRFGFAISQSNTPSEFRDFVDNNRLPIQQTTEFRRVPLTASLKAYLSPPGRSVGHFAWIPSRYAPYVGGGAGAMWYRFQQYGDFIDFTTYKVFPDSFLSDGWTPTLHAFAGTDVSLNPRFAVTFEGRYEWAHKELSADFARFQPIDLSGFALTAGFVVRY